MNEKLPVFNSKPDALAESISTLYGNKLTPEELAEAKDDLLGFFELLVQLDKSNEERSNEEQEPIPTS